MRDLLMLLLAVSVWAECPSSHPYMCGSRDDVTHPDLPNHYHWAGPCCDKDPDCLCDDYCGPDCNDGAAPVDGCDQSYCTSPGDRIAGKITDCWAGSEVEPCTCSKGTARLTGRTLYHDKEACESQNREDNLNRNCEETYETTYYEYTCCTGEESGKNQGEVCGNYKFAGCDPSLCTAAHDEAVIAEHGEELRCWAGTPWLACTCSSGSARLTGRTHHEDKESCEKRNDETSNCEEMGDWEFTMYEYTCCPDDANSENQGIKCGDYTHLGNPVFHFFGGLMAFCCCNVCCCASCCIFCKCCKCFPCNKHNRARQHNGSTGTPHADPGEKLGERVESKTTTDTANPTVTNGTVGSIEN